MRNLNEKEETRLAALTSQSVEVSLLETTATGLKKSILDATSPVRRFLKEKKLHDYDLQKQGPEDKVVLPAILVTDKLMIPSQASLYRPNTKKGDPRIWFKGLQHYAKPNDIVSLTVFEEKIYVMNLTQINIGEILSEHYPSPILELIREIKKKSDNISQELLSLIREVAKKGPIKSVIDTNADTAIGRTLETLLGIKQNSSKLPDYKGIELKSSRDYGNNRKTLFAQVANWELSKFKSSKEILEHFGYQRGDETKLYCTVSTKSKNSQGLSLRVDQNLDHLIENSERVEIGDFAVWLIEDLRKRLLEKHNETFWVSASSKIENGSEYFQFNKILHTKKPIVSQFDILVDQGMITMDHLIKKNSKGRVVEKGPLFKIRPSAIEMLFPTDQTYIL